MEDLFLIATSLIAGVIAGYGIFALTEKKRFQDKILHLEDRLQDERARSHTFEELLKSSKESFKGVSLEALRDSSEAFLKLANSTFERAFEKNDAHWQKKAESELKPIREALERCNKEIQELEKSRIGAYATLKEQVSSLLESQVSLKKETASLVSALRTPHVRGRWGEMQLRRVVELAGMVPYCDFIEQQSENTTEGRLRPDLIVRLPGDRNIVVDSKVPLSSYLESIESTDDEMRKAKLKDHARLLRNHIGLLSKKNYGEHFQPAPEFVVLFLPGESLFSAALEHDPMLLELGAEAKVILATPTTLIALLKSVFYGWRQERLSKSAEEIALLGRELYKRLSDMGGHFAKMGKSLEDAVEAYNKTCGSFESRVLVSARRFEELQATSLGKTIEPLETIDKTPRKIEEI